MPILLAFVAGAVDTTTFLSMSGFFAAHVTGNLVILGATLVLGHPTGVWSKVLALPVFVATVWLVTVVADLLQHHRADLPRLLLGIELALLCVALAGFVEFGPYTHPDRPLAVINGLILVGAMAVQNALAAIVYPHSPPTTVMTTNMTRLFVDLATLAAGKASDAAEHARLRRQSARLAAAGTAFLLGCGAAALGHIVIHAWFLAIPTACIAGALAITAMHPEDCGQ